MPNRPWVSRERGGCGSNPSPCTDASQAFPCVECDSHSRHQPWRFHPALGWCRNSRSDNLRINSQGCIRSSQSETWHLCQASPRSAPIKDVWVNTGAPYLHGEVWKPTQVVRQTHEWVCVFLFFSQAATLDAWGRLFHPAEIGLIHGERQNMFVDQDMELAWKIMGNLIMPYQYHAMIPLMHVANHFLPTDLQSKTH